MSTFLDDILTLKQAEIDALKAQFSISYFVEKAEQANFEDLSLQAALEQPGLSLIAELKKASPSKGVLRANFDPIALADAFVKQGASALSVLTEKHYFMGHPDILTQVKKHVSIPILRKDFIVDPIQVAEAKAMGADAILLIMACLDLETCQELINQANMLHLDVLLEVHQESELEEALQLSGVKIIGFNNRDLRTFDVDMDLAPRLLKILNAQHPEYLTIAESGYKTQDELKTLEKLGFNAALIGEGLIYNPLTPSNDTH